MAEQSLKDKTIKGVGWSALDNVLQYVVSFGVSIILARLLVPEDYGLLGLIAIFTTVSATLINGGFSSALIRKKDATEDDYNTAFIVNLGMSLFLYTIIFCCSPLIASFFNRSELVALTRVSTLGLIIGALALVQQTRLTKRIDFKKQTKITLVASIVSGIIGVLMAILDFGVWALVGQSLSTYIVRTYLLWHYNKWIPKARFSTDSFRQLFGFGWKLMVSGLLDTVWKELHKVIIGKYYEPATLGQFTRAGHFSQLFSTNITKVVQRVTFPVLSELQDDKMRMLNSYKRIIKTTMLISTACMFLLGAISEPLIICLIGEKWREATSYLPLICITGSLYPLHAINLNMLQVQGRSDLFLKLEIVKKVIALGPLFIGAFVGIISMLYAGIVISIISFFLNSYYTGKMLGYTSWMQIKDITPSYGIAIVIALSVFFLKYLPFSYWVILPFQIVVGIIVFFILCKCLKLEEYENSKALITPFVNKLKLYT